MPSSSSWGKSARGKVAREGKCRCCDATEDLSRHHLIPQRWFRKNPGRFGRHNPLNLVPLCFHCHRVIDGHLPTKNDTPKQTRRYEKRRQLRANLTKEEVQFVASIRGQPWLDHQYPATTRNHDFTPAAITMDQLPTEIKYHLPACDANYCAVGCRVRSRPLRIMSRLVPSG